MMGASMFRNLAILAAFAALTAAGAASAREAEGEGWKLSGDIGVVSDYQYRGYSLSGSDWAVQAGLTVAAPHGFYFGVWGSRIEEYGVGSDGDGARVEIDLSVGRTFSAAGWDWDVALLRYGYPDGSDVDYFEIPVSAARTAGAFTTTLGSSTRPVRTISAVTTTSISISAETTRRSIGRSASMPRSVTSGARSPTASWTGSWAWPRTLDR